MIKIRTKLWKFLPGMDMLHLEMILPGDWSAFVKQDPPQPDGPSPRSAPPSEERLPKNP